VTALESMRAQQKEYLTEREKQLELIQAYSESIRSLNAKVRVMPCRHGHRAPLPIVGNRMRLCYSHNL
jgi:hypothetical protein